MFISFVVDSISVVVVVVLYNCTRRRWGGRKSRGWVLPPSPTLMKESGNNNFYFEFTTRSAAEETFAGIQSSTANADAGEVDDGMGWRCYKIPNFAINLSVTVAIKPPTEPPAPLFRRLCSHRHLGLIIIGGDGGRGRGKGSIIHRHCGKERRSSVFRIV